MFIFRRKLGKLFKERLFSSIFTESPSLDEMLASILCDFTILYSFATDSSTSMSAIPYGAQKVLQRAATCVATRVVREGHTPRVPLGMCVGYIHLRNRTEDRRQKSSSIHYVPCDIPGWGGRALASQAVTPALRPQRVEKVCRTLDQALATSSDVLPRSCQRYASVC